MSFIFTIIMIAWTMKLFLHAQTPVHSFGEFYNALAVHELPTWLASVVFFGTIMPITGLTVFVARTISEEVSEFGSGNRSHWRI